MKDIVVRVNLADGVETISFSGVLYMVNEILNFISRRFEGYSN